MNLLNGGCEDMTKQCPQCKRELEFNECNFRFSCDGYQRSTCRSCQNKRKSIRYQNQKKNKVKNPNTYKEARKKRMQAMIVKYDEIFKTLDALGVSYNATAEYVDKVLAEVCCAAYNISA
jgi:hypothetical protein